MSPKKRRFETRGPVDPSRNYVVHRTSEISDLVERMRAGRYIVIFGPRQTGKTTFFRWAVDALLTTNDDTYCPIQLDFETYRNMGIERFYKSLLRDIREEVIKQSQRLGFTLTAESRQFLEDNPLTDHDSFQSFLKALPSILENRRVVFIIDEFDGIPPVALSDFLYTLQHIYLSQDATRCPYSVGIVGVKSIAQLNYDRSISPFNIQDDFALPNFTLAQVNELLIQYTDDVGQRFDPNAIEYINKQTAGQPFLVNRMAQILTEEMDIPHAETITLRHAETAHQQILDDSNPFLTVWNTIICQRILTPICQIGLRIRTNRS